VISSTYSYSAVIDIPAAVRPFLISNNLFLRKVKDSARFFDALSKPTRNRGTRFEADPA
jgi:hypothetical protein